LRTRFAAPAPKFCAVNVDTAFPVAIIGTMHMDSILMPEVYPASAEEPNPFTTDCTNSIPTETIDCCTMDGIAILTILPNIPKL